MKAEIVNETKVPGFTEKEAADWHKSLVESSKDIQVRKIKFAHDLFVGQAKNAYLSLGYESFEDYANAFWKDKTYHYQTIRKAIGLFKAMKQQVEGGTSGEDEAIQKTVENLNSLIKAADGNMSYVREAVRYNIADEMEKVESFMKGSENLPDFVGTMRNKFKGKELNPGKVAAQRKIAAEDYVSVVFSVPRDDVSTIKEVLEINSKKFGTSKPFEDMAPGERGKLLISILAENMSGSFDDVTIATEESKNMIVKELLKKAIGIKIGYSIDEENPELFGKIVSIFGEAVEKAMQRS